MIEEPAASASPHVTVPVLPPEAVLVKLVPHEPPLAAAMHVPVSHFSSFRYCFDMSDIQIYRDHIGVKGLRSTGAAGRTTGPPGPQPPRRQEAHSISEKSPMIGAGAC
jgi:hypothetical protein